MADDDDEIQVAPSMGSLITESEAVGDEDEDEDGTSDSGSWESDSSCSEASPDTPVLHHRKKQIPLSVQEQLAKSQQIVRYTGISVEWLLDFWQEVLDGDIMGHVKLVVTETRLASDVGKGKTMELVSKNVTDELGVQLGRVPRRKPGDFQVFTEDQVYSKPRSDWTVGDVCDFVIMPMVAENKCLFIDMPELINPGKYVGRPFEGDFVSYARSSRFEDLVAALEEHYERKNNNKGIPDRTFVFLDIFCANQCLLHDDESEEIVAERRSHLAEGLHAAIKYFDEKLFFFDTWVRPAAMNRAWCIWEMYGAIKAKDVLTMILSPYEEARFDTILRSGDGDNVARDIYKIKPHEAKCSDPADLELIRDTFKQTLGWSELKHILVDQVMEFLVKTTETVVDRHAKESPENVFLVLNQATKMMEHAGRFEKALEFGQRAFADRFKFHGVEENLEVAETQMNVGNVYQADGKYDQALAYYLRVLKTRKQLYGTESQLDVIDALNNMAHTYYLMGNYERALEVYDRTYDARKDLYGTKEHPDVIRTLSNMAIIYEEQGDHDEAFHMYHKVLDIKTSMHGTEAHDDVIETINDMAQVYEDQGNYEKALEFYQRALSLKKTLHGTEDHASVAMTLHTMANVHLTQGIYDQAIELYQRALCIRKVVYKTDNHADIANTLHDLGRVHHELGEFSTALELKERAVKIWISVHGTELRPEVVKTFYKLLAGYEALGDYTKAHELQLDLFLYLNSAEYDDPDSVSPEHWTHDRQTLKRKPSAKDEGLDKHEYPLALVGPTKVTTKTRIKQKLLSKCICS